MGDGQFAAIPAGGESGGGEAAVVIQKSRQSRTVGSRAHIHRDRGSVHHDGEGDQGGKAVGEVEAGSAGGSRRNGNSSIYFIS